MKDQLYQIPLVDQSVKRINGDPEWFEGKYDKRSKDEDRKKPLVSVLRAKRKDGSGSAVDSPSAEDT